MNKSQEFTDAYFEPKLHVEIIKREGIDKEQSIVWMQSLAMHIYSQSRKIVSQSNTACSKFLFQLIIYAMDDRLGDVHETIVDSIDFILRSQSNHTILLWISFQHLTNFFANASKGFFIFSLIIKKMHKSIL